ncbi:dihydrodipicolinate synthase family protein [Aciditerrimonas ferrireducens]|uniref:Dihydrodipicolinate synthase family protein n=1 Tax=Aciditerrimonas ferrireducens TaxID=667306 RepID=A0ABV6C053_9ACTN
MAVALPYTRSEAKERARTWRGMCNVTLPSFTSDFRGLNDEAIRHDVRLAAQMGFWGTLVASECGTTLEEYLHFLEVAADAAPEGFRIVAHLSFSTFEETVQVAKASEAIGVEAGLLAYPPSFVPKAPSDVVAWTRDVAERTDLALIVFAVTTWGYRSMSPQSFPHEAIVEMADIDTAAAVKYEANPPGIVAGLADVLRRCGDRIVVQCPMEHTAPALIEWFGMPWMGTSGYEAFGDRVPRWFSLLHEGKWDEGMELYWSYQPAREAKGAWSQTWAGSNLIHRVGWKYLGWLQGYNGGLLRMPQMRLHPGQMRMLRAGVEASGFEVPSDDSGFATGRFPA